MAEPRKHRPLVSLRGQITLYITVVVLALLASAFSGIQYYDMARAVGLTLQKNGIPPESREYERIMDAALFLRPFMLIPVAVVGIMALACWGVCLLGLQAALRAEPSSNNRGDQPETISD